MIKQAPSVGRILTMVAFSLSCFGIVLFLWLSFGSTLRTRPTLTPEMRTSALCASCVASGNATVTR